MDKKSEWLETDGLGGFASGTAAGVRTRRYHGLLLTARTPPTGRFMLVNGLEAWVQTPGGVYPLSSQIYTPGVVHPDGFRRIDGFEAEPWPRWRFQLEDGLRIEQELFVTHGTPLVTLSWRLLGRREGVVLFVRPLLSGRDYHQLHHENPNFSFYPRVHQGRITWRPYEGLPSIVAFANGDYTHQPDWYRNFFYEEEQARGLDCTEDLASPGVFRWDLSQNEAAFILAVEGSETQLLPQGATAEACLMSLRDDERRRRQRFPSRLHRSADAYLVRRGNGRTLVAGYPWFTDWGRDTFIALRGLCLATGRLEDALAILLEWTDALSEGMMPNRFPDQGLAPEFNSVDASLWYVVAVHDFFRAVDRLQFELGQRDRVILQEGIETILAAYTWGTRHGIRLDNDGLLAAGVPGQQLTWMDARVNGREVTPRIGKPVEIQALWLNALHAGGSFSERWKNLFLRGRPAFEERFWNEAGHCLYDVVDVDHKSGKVDATVRPNQILAVGGLPLAVLEGDRARQVVATVETNLWTPLGLRSLAPNEPGYVPYYQGGVSERDGAYHQGTAWPWLIGPFVEAWLRTRGGTPEARQEAQTRFLQPLFHHLNDGGLGHISELADGDPPHTARGCPFQAWSLAEFLRLSEVVLASEEASSYARSA